jgi:hypothetical protein
LNRRLRPPARTSTVVPTATVTAVATVAAIAAPASATSITAATTPATVTAAAPAPAITTAAAAVAASATAAAAAGRPLFTGPRFADGNRPPFDAFAVELADGVGRFLVRRHRHEGKAAALACDAILDQGHIFDRACLAEEIHQIRLGRIKGQISYIESITHVSLLEGAALRLLLRFAC